MVVAVTDLREHGPAAVRAELAEGFDHVPRHWIRAIMAGCDGCVEWTRRRAADSRRWRRYGPRRGRR